MVDFDQALLELMEPADRARAEALLRAQYGCEPVVDYIRRLYPNEPPQRHMMPILEAIERSRYERVFEAFSMPPRHGKSICLQRGLAWRMKHSLADLNAYVTYSKDQALAMSRPVMLDAEELAGVRFIDGARSLSEMRTNIDGRMGGGLIARGVKSGLTGRGVHGLMVFDDPYADRDEAESPVQRETLWELFTSVVLTRLENASCIIVHTRWVEDDLIGRLKAKHEAGELPKAFPWKFTNLPALAEADDPLGREVGEALWPDGPQKFDREYLLALEQMDPWMFAALYQGRPRPRGSQLFQEPATYDPATLSLDGMRIYIGADPAATANTQNDMSVAVALGIKGTGPTKVGYVLDVMRGHWEIPDFAARLVAFQRKWWGAPAAVESVAGFKAVPQTMRILDRELRIVEAPPIGDKYIRATPAAAAWNAGRLLLPRSHAPQYQWVVPFKKICRDFTGVGDAHDDDVDALAHAWNSVEYIPAPPRRGAVVQPARLR